VLTAYRHHQLLGTRVADTKLCPNGLEGLPLQSQIERKRVALPIAVGH